MNKCDVMTGFYYAFRVPLTGKLCPYRWCVTPGVFPVKVMSTATAPYNGRPTVRVCVDEGDQRWLIGKCYITGKRDDDIRNVKKKDGRVYADILTSRLVCSWYEYTETYDQQTGKLLEVAA